MTDTVDEVQALQAAIDRIKAEQQPLRDEVATLRAQLAWGDEQVRRRDVAIAALSGEATVTPKTKAPRGHNPAIVLGDLEAHPNSLINEISERTCIKDTVL